MEGPRSFSGLTFQWDNSTCRAMAAARLWRARLGVPQGLSAASLRLPEVPVINFSRAVSEGTPKRALHNLAAAIALQVELSARNVSQKRIGHRNPASILRATCVANKLSKVDNLARWPPSPAEQRRRSMPVKIPATLHLAYNVSQ